MQAVCRPRRGPLSASRMTVRSFYDWCCMSMRSFKVLFIIFWLMSFPSPPTARASSPVCRFRTKRVGLLLVDESLISLFVVHVFSSPTPHLAVPHFTHKARAAHDSPVFSSLLYPRFPYNPRIVSFRPTFFVPSWAEPLPPHPIPSHIILFCPSRPFLSPCSPDR